MQHKIFDISNYIEIERYKSILEDFLINIQLNYINDEEVVQAPRGLEEINF